MNARSCFNIIRILPTRGLDMVLSRSRFRFSGAEPHRALKRCAQNSQLRGDSMCVLPWKRLRAE